MSDTHQALAILRQQFTEQLGPRFEAIRTKCLAIDPARWQPEEAEALLRITHSLTGSAGTFGLAAISEHARVLEEALAAILRTSLPPEAAAWHAVTQALDLLEQGVRSQLSGVPSLEPRHGKTLNASASPLIHVVEDDPEQASFLIQSLRDRGYRVRHFSDHEEFSLVIRSKADEIPAAVVMDMIFPEGDSAGASTIAALDGGANADIPVIFVSVRDDLSARLAAYRAGATRYLAKPVDARQLCRILDELTRRVPPEAYRVLLVDDDEAVLEFHAAVLKQAGMEVSTLSTPLQTLKAIETVRPEVVVLDVYMPDASGLELAQAIREQDRYMNLPILFLSGESDLTKQLRALGLGGDDFLLKPAQPEHLVSAVEARARRARDNTDTWQRLQQTLYEREREHLALDKHALVSITDRAGLITDANDNFCKVSGYRLEELLGQDHRILKSDGHPPAFYHDMWTTLKAGNIWRGEICNRRKDGSFFWVNATITPFLDGKGQVYQFVSIHTDITALKQSQETLRAAKDRLRRGQIYANIGTWDWNIVSGDLFWSERIGPLFGYPEGELETTYGNFLAAVHPDDRQAVTDAVNACVEHDASYEIEHRVVWPDGTVRWLLERGAVLRDASGKATQMLGVVQDIDARKRAEQALAESESKLADANRMLQLVLDNIPVRVYWKDVNLHYLGCNRAFAGDAGHQTAEEVAGLDDLAMPWAQLAEAYRREDIEVMTSRSPKLDYEEAQTAPNGELIWHNTSKVPLLDAQDRLVGVLGIYADITARKLAEQALIAAREEADRANQAKSEFLSSMSHELRTPMNAILGFSQLLESAPSLAEGHRDFVKEILNAGRHLLDLINEVLDLVKVESGRISLSLEMVEICPLLDECLSLIAPLAEKRGIRISHDGLEGLSVQADSMRLKQVLLNLLSNAIKYNREGGSVHLEAQLADATQLRLLVRDTGPGIPPERLAELFQPFNRLGAENSGIEGTGIGLTISRRIMEMMGGAVEVDSKTGVGSTFWIELPWQGDVRPGSARQVARATGAMPQPTPEVARHDVLYFEDNPSNIKLMVEVMKTRRDMQLHTAHLPELGLELAQRHRPALILLDINMPGMDGYQVLKRLRGDASLARIPVVAVTANAMLDDIEHGKEAGFDDYLTKPLNLARLFEVFDRYLTPAGNVEREV